MILSLETSSPVCGVSLHSQGQLLDEQYINEANMHSERLTNLVKNSLEKHTLSPEEISMIAISTGPGSFTGLRIGMSFAKGLAYPHKIPLAAVNTLKAFRYFHREMMDKAIYPLCIFRSHRENIFVMSADSDEIDYLTRDTLLEKYPKTDFIISNDEDLAVENIPFKHSLIMASMMGQYVLDHKEMVSTTQYESIRIQYGMEYKPKTWSK